jgi:hypothetical protein
MSPTPRWSTASFGETTDTTPLELAALGEHLTQCSGASGHLVAMQCGAQRLGGFVTARLVTTLMVLAAIISVCLMVW